ncbi:regulator of G protein signaling domain-containing protein [Amylostereum chailletii]|nr:regulator of G protein signaling domain-containing protein [Amylostereum chailletii]
MAQEDTFKFLLEGCGASNVMACNLSSQLSRERGRLCQASRPRRKDHFLACPVVQMSHQHSTERLLCKDLYDLFAMFIVALPLTTHHPTKYSSFEHSFTHAEALSIMPTLNLCQTRLAPSPSPPSPKSTKLGRKTTARTSASFPRTSAAAHALCQSFMAGRLIQRASNPTSALFSDSERETYVPTPKGMHVLHHFMMANGVENLHIQPVFDAIPPSPYLVHLQRDPRSDAVVWRSEDVKAIFRHFVGRTPNKILEGHSSPRGIFLQPIGGAIEGSEKARFRAIDALRWLCDFTTVRLTDDAGYLAAEFVRLGLITLVRDQGGRRKEWKNVTVVFMAQGHERDNQGARPEFQYSRTAVYEVTNEGAQVARWSHHSSPSSSTFSQPFIETNLALMHTTLSNPLRLSSFRSFVRHTGEKMVLDLEVWLACEELKRRLILGSSVLSCTTLTEDHVREAGRMHCDRLISRAVGLYETYLATDAARIVDVTPGLREEIDELVNEVQGLRVGVVQDLNTMQLANVVRLYERVQTVVFRRLAGDAFPEFFNSPEYGQVKVQLDELGLRDANVWVPGAADLHEEHGVGIYVTLAF